MYENPGGPWPSCPPLPTPMVPFGLLDPSIHDNRKIYNFRWEITPRPSTCFSDLQYLRNTNQGFSNDENLSFGGVGFRTNDDAFIMPLGSQIQT